MTKVSRQYRLDELVHYGIKGQKWGQRRYQNKDGSLTPAGKKRYSDASWDGPEPTLRELGKMKNEDPERYAKYQEYSKAKGYDKAVKEQQKDVDKFVKDAAKENKKGMDVDKVSTDLNTAKKMYDKVAPAIIEKEKAKVKKEHSDKIKMDLANMSDDELRQIVNRLNMEERYTQIMNSRYQQVGKSKTEKILDGVGTALSIGTSAVSLAIAIKKLQG